MKTLPKLQRGAFAEKNHAESSLQLLQIHPLEDTIRAEMKAKSRFSCSLTWAFFASTVLGALTGACHAQDDIHAGSLGEQCGTCHNVRSFAPARFAHSNVGFTLVGTHRMLACNRCHSAGNYVGLSGDCISCHLDDAIRAANTTTTGQQHRFFVAQPCNTCHNQNSWLSRPYMRKRFSR